VKAPWRKVRDWLFLDQFERPNGQGAGTADFPPFAWKSAGPAGSTVVRSGELIVSGAGGQLVGAYNELTAAPLYTVEGTVTLNQTNAPNQWFALISNGWTQRIGLMAHGDGFIYYMGSSRRNGVAPSDLWMRSDRRYEANKAYRFKMRVDCRARKAEYSFDGSRVGEGHFAKYGSPSCVIAATQHSHGIFRLGEIAIYRDEVRPETDP
jgi:hypothetical protein